MPNIINADGLQTATREELVEFYTEAFQTIYGADIDLSSNSPDGQMMNIFIQSVLDLEDLLVQIYNQFDPDNAIGVVLDQRVAINGIQRQAGTFTEQNVTIVTSQALNLYGLDQDEQPVFTVADNAGNQWQLKVTQNVGGAGSYSYAFQAAEPGAIQSAINTITVPVTIVLGVVSINNPTTYTSLGINEESDAVLKVRRQKSVSLASQGYLAGLLAALENINGVTAAFVYENNTDATDGDGVPSHSIWVIVAGTADASEIAQAIYTKRNAGCGMFGDITYTVTQVDGSPFVVRWSDVVIENVFILLTTVSLDGVNPVNVEAIRTDVPELYRPGVNEELNTNRLATYVQVADPNCLVTSGVFSTGRSQNYTLSDIPTSGTFKLSYNGSTTPSMNYNLLNSLLQTRIRALPGLETAVVTGRPVDGSFSVDLSDAETIEGLITVTDNALLASGTPVTFVFDGAFTLTLEPTSKNNQFALASENVIITPMQLTPPLATVADGEDQQFEGLGGYGDPMYSISVNNSGGSIDASTGLYTAGSTPDVVDTVKVTDGLGNSATALVTVT